MIYARNPPNSSTTTASIIKAHPVSGRFSLGFLAMIRPSPAGV